MGDFAIRKQAPLGPPGRLIVQTDGQSRFVITAHGACLFLADDGSETLRLDPDGSIFVRGRRAGDDPEVVAGFLVWARALLSEFVKMTEQPCERCGGTGQDPEHAGPCGACAHPGG